MDPDILHVPRPHLHNLCKTIDHILPLLPLCAPPLHPFRPTLSTARLLLRALLDPPSFGFTLPSHHEAVSQPHTTLSRTGPYRLCDNLDRWHRLLASYGAGRLVLTEAFRRVQRDVGRLVRLSGWRSSRWWGRGGAERLHLRLQLDLGILAAVLRGLRAMERDYRPRAFEVARGALEEGWEEEEDLGEGRPSDVPGIDVLLLEGEDMAVVNGVQYGVGPEAEGLIAPVKVTRREVQDAAVRQWRQDVKLNYNEEKNEQEDILNKHIRKKWSWLAHTGWHEIQLPPQEPTLPGEEQVDRGLRRRSVLGFAKWVVASLKGFAKYERLCPTR